MSETSTPLEIATDCWLSIGVWSAQAPSCPDLARVIHCRNCPTFVAAGRQMLDALPPSIETRRAEGWQWRGEAAVQDEASALVVRVGREWLGLAMTECSAVSPLRSVRRVPHRTAGALLGLVAVRGRLIPCCSLSILLGIPQEPPDGRSETARLVVAGPEAEPLAFPVDEIARVHRFSGGDLQPPPATLSAAMLTHTQGVLRLPDRGVTVLNVPAVLRSASRAVGR